MWVDDPHENDDGGSILMQDHWSTHKENHSLGMDVCSHQRENEDVKTHSNGVKDNCLEEAIWDNDSREVIDEEEMEAISSMFEDHSSRVHDVCEEKSTQDYPKGEIENDEIIFDESHVVMTLEPSIDKDENHSHGVTKSFPQEVKREKWCLNTPILNSSRRITRSEELMVAFEATYVERDMLQNSFMESTKSNHT